MNGTMQSSLANIGIFADLDTAERQVIEKLCRWKRYGASEQVFDRQSANRDVFFIIEGRVRVVIYSVTGREVSFDDAASGSVFGELAAIDGRPRSASIMALAPTLLATLAPDTFLEVLARHPEVSQRLMRRLAEVIRTSTERILDLSTMAANNRVHAEVLRLARLRISGTNEATLRPIPVHGEIASRVSTTRETVARVLSDLARSGLVRRTRDALIVTDVRKLTDMVVDVRGEDVPTVQPPPVLRVTVRRKETTAG